MVVKEDHKWISLSLTKPQQQDPAHLAYKITTTQLDKMLKKKEVERAFLGIIRLVKEESQGMEAPEESMATMKPKSDEVLPS